MASEFIEKVNASLGAVRSGTPGKAPHITFEDLVGAAQEIAQLRQSIFQIHQYADRNPKNLKGIVDKIAETARDLVVEGGLKEEDEPPPRVGT